MKLLLSIVLCVWMLFGCKQPADTAPTQTRINLESTLPAVTEATNPPMTTEKVSGEDGHMITVYAPNEDVTGFIYAGWEIPEITVTAIFDALIEAGVLNGEVEANSLEVKGTQLFLDVNSAFGTQINGYGTSGEYYMMGSVVNTLLNAYQAETVSITINGEILETGHSIYDYTLEFYPETE